MTQEEKELITKTLCEGMFYGIKVNISASMEYDNYIPSINDATIIALDLRNERCNFNEFYWDKKIVNVRPYLRPLSSMTEEEIKYLTEHLYIADSTATYGKEVEMFVKYSVNCIEYCCKHHLDYRGLIPMGLALEAPEGMYVN